MFQGLPCLKNSLEELELIIEIRTDTDFINLSTDHAGYRKLEDFFKLNKKAPSTFNSGTLTKNVSSAPTFQNLIRLELECNDFLTADALEGLVCNSPHLRHLNLASTSMTNLKIYFPLTIAIYIFYCALFIFLIFLFIIAFLISSISNNHRL